MSLEGSVQKPKTSPGEFEKHPLFFFPTCLFSHWKVVSVEHIEMAHCEGFPNIIKIHFIYSLHVIKWEDSSPEILFSLSHILPYEHTPRKWSRSYTRKSNISSTLCSEEYQMSCDLVHSQRWWPLAWVSYQGSSSFCDSCWLTSLHTPAFHQTLLASNVGLHLTCKSVVWITVRRILLQIFYLRF